MVFFVVFGKETALKLNGVGDMLTVDGAAQALGTSYMRVWRFIRKNDIPTARIGKNLLVRIVDVQGISKEVRNATTTRN